MRQVPSSEWLANGAERALCTLPHTADDMARQYGLAFEALNQNLRLSRFAVVEHDGMVFLLSAVPEAQAPACLVGVEVRGDVRAPAHALRAIASAVGCTIADLPWMASDLSEASWAVLRTPLGGQGVVWSYFADRAFAEQSCIRLRERDSQHEYSIESAEC